MSKVYVLTHCAAEENYTPRVFTNKKDAQKALKEDYQELKAGNNEFIYSKECGTNFAEIIWDDDTYNRLDIFEVEVE